MADYFGIRSRGNMVVTLMVALAIVVICNPVSASVVEQVSDCGLDEAIRISDDCSKGDVQACCDQIVYVGSACICDSNVLTLLGNLDLTQIRQLIGDGEICAHDNIQQDFACLHD